MTGCLCIVVNLYRIFANLNMRDPKTIHTRDTSKPPLKQNIPTSSSKFSTLYLLLPHSSSFISLLHPNNHACWGSLPPAINFYRSCVGLEWLAQETTGFILVRASEELYPTSSVLLPRSWARCARSRGYNASWSGERVRSQVLGDGVRSYEGLTLVTVALLSLL
jgi:hypothetical protein